MSFEDGQEYGSSTSEGPMVRDAMFLAKTHTFQSCYLAGKQEWWFSDCRCVFCVCVCVCVHAYTSCMYVPHVIPIFVFIILYSSLRERKIFGNPFGDEIKWRKANNIINRVNISIHYEPGISQVGLKRELSIILTDHH